MYEVTNQRWEWEPTKSISETIPAPNKPQPYTSFLGLQRIEMITMNSIATMATNRMNAVMMTWWFKSLPTMVKLLPLASMSYGVFRRLETFPSTVYTTTNIYNHLV
jgi:tellurite resistance protein TehA-like permease